MATTGDLNLAVDKGPHPDESPREGKAVAEDTLMRRHHSETGQLGGPADFGQGLHVPRRPLERRRQERLGLVVASHDPESLHPPSADRLGGVEVALGVQV
jgi:hypothetical protein